jgi:hypothetical protein
MPQDCESEVDRCAVRALRLRRSGRSFKRGEHGRRVIERVVPIRTTGMRFVVFRSICRSEALTPIIAAITLSVT